MPAAAKSGVKAISAGFIHSVALKKDGTIVVWGGNFSGQKKVPASAKSKVRAIAAGTHHNLAIISWSKAPVPVISGKAKVGAVLKAKPGAWSPKPTSFKYQWYRSGKAIPKATKSSYKLVKADAGKTIKVKVTGVKSGYPKLSKTSKPTKKVTK